MKQEKDIMDSYIMNMGRRAGVLMHVSSLPGDHGIGDIGESAHAFVDALADMDIARPQTNTGAAKKRIPFIKRSFVRNLGFPSSPLTPKIRTKPTPSGPLGYHHRKPPKGSSRYSTIELLTG